MLRDIGRFIAKRLVSLVLIEIGVAVITFIVTRLVPSNPAAQIAGIGASPQGIAAVRRRLGLSKGIWIQFGDYLNDLIHLNFGRSFVTGNSVASDIGARLPATLELAFAAVLIYVVASVLLGVVAAAGKSKFTEGVIRLTTLAGSSVPPYWLALLLQVVFYYFLNWFPPGGRLPIALNPPPHVTGFYTIDSLLAGQWHTFLESLYCLVLPALSLALVTIGSLTRLIRAQIIGEQSADYVTMSTAKGIGRWRTTWRHVLPNAMNPVMTVVGVQIGFLIGGTIYVEQIFQWPGLGSYTWSAIAATDFPAITGVALTLSTVFVVITFIVELAQYLLDPRVRVERGW